MSDDDSEVGEVVIPVKRDGKGKFTKTDVANPRRIGVQRKESTPEDAPFYPAPEPTTPVADPAPAPDPAPEPPPKTWRCPVPYCKNPLWPDETALRAHMLNAHKRTYRGGGKMVNGATVDPRQPITLPGGYMADARDINVSVDIYTQLRNILDSFGVADIREGIVDSFASEDNPTDIKRLKVLLTQAAVQPSRVNMIIDRWARYMTNIGMAVEEVEEEQKKRESKGNPLKASFDDMANWGPGEWMQFNQQMQKQAMAMKMYNMMTQNMMAGMGFSGGDMNAMGVPSSQPQQLPREIQIQLDELKQFRERDKLKEALDPVMRTLNNLRADFEDTKQAAPKKDSMADLMDMVKMQQLLKTMGPQHDKDADVMRVQMEERIETKKMQMEKEYRELALRMEAAKEANHQLEMRNIQTEMSAKIDNLKTLNEVASRDKGQDLESVINNALRVQETLKKLQGDNETDDDKKMKTIMGAIQGTIESVAPSIDKMATGYMLSQQAKAAGARGPAGPPPGRSNVPSGMGQRPPAPQNARPLAKCTNPECNREFEVDPNSPTAQCPGCYTVYNIGQGPQGGRQGPSQAPMGDTNAKRQTLLRMDRSALEEVARGDGIDPDQYPTHEMLVDAMMGQ